MNKKKPVKLSEYVKYPFLIPKTELDFKIFDDVMEDFSE